MALTITLPDRAERAPLYCRYERQSRPQPARITLDLRDGRVGAEYNAEIGSGDYEAAWVGIVRTYPVPAAITGEALHRLVERLTPLLERVARGGAVDQDRHGHHRSVLDDDAQEAEREIAREIEGVDLADDVAQTWDAEEWLLAGGTTEGAARTLGITAATTDDALAARAAELEQEADSDGVVLTGDTVLDVLRGMRQAVRAEEDA